MSPVINVQTVVRQVPFLEPFSAYLLLRNVFSPDGVYLLESLAGPEEDSGVALIGFRPLITIEIRNCRVGFVGESRLIDMISRAAIRLGAIRSEAGSLMVEEEGGVWKLLRAVQSRFVVDHPNPGASYAFGFFGYFGYDTVRFIEKLPYKIESTSTTPDICLVLFQGVVKFDLMTRTSHIVCAYSDCWRPTEPDEVARLLDGASKEVSDEVPTVPAPLFVKDSITPQQYYETVRRALHHIGIGDIYQVQLGHELAIQSTADPLAVYRRLRVRNPAPYMYIAQLGAVTLVGASPEVFLKIEGNKISMRPLAGTIRRGRSATEDREAAAKLRSDEKEVAEHIMLVDLCRNDIGRICIPKTLNVTELLATEAYSHVFHLVSNVVGYLAPRIDIYDAIAATFPAGTMTGAPKVRAIEIIEDLETARRGVYAGAVGLIDFSGYANLALCIRTAVRTGQEYFIRASAGIVADSQPEREWHETIAKLGATYWAIAGKELIP